MPLRSIGLRLIAVCPAIHEIFCKQACARFIVHAGTSHASEIPLRCISLRLIAVCQSRPSILPASKLASDG